MSLSLVNTENFDSAVNINGLVVVYFSATWCGPCKTATPLIEKLSTELNIIVYKLDVDESFKTANALSIMSVPTIIAFRDGKENSRHSGVGPKLEEWFKAL
jgi:thioredoxin 1